MKTVWVGLIAGLPLALGACATGISVGDAPSDPPPVLVEAEGELIWRNISSFGPVPESEARRGDRVCSRLNTEAGETFVAAGYHPAAVNSDGEAFENGGFFCRQQ